MSKVSITRSKLDSLADAIGSKSSRGIPLTIDQMRDAVLNIEMGITPSGTKNITKNGTYDVTEYASTEVNIQPKLQAKSIHPSTESQTITSDSNYDGLSSVNVEAISLIEKTVTPSTSEQVVVTNFVEPGSLLQRKTINESNILGSNLNSVLNSALGDVSYTTESVYFIGSVNVLAEYKIGDDVLYSATTIITIDGYSSWTGRGWTSALSMYEYSGSNVSGMRIGSFYAKGHSNNSTFISCSGQETSSYYRYSVSG